MVGHLMMRRALGALLGLWLALFAAPAFAGYAGPVIFDTGDCLTGGPVPPTPKTIKGKFPVNIQAGASYTVASGDRCKLVKFTGAAAVSVTLPQAGTNFPSGWMAFFQSRGAGGVTITPAAGTIEGASSLALAQNAGAIIFSDGSDYHVFTGGGSVPICTRYQILRMGASALQCEDAPYDLGGFMPGVPDASAIILWGIPRGVLLPSGLAGAVCTALAAAAGSTTVTLNKISGGSSSPIGTMVWSASGRTCSVTFAGNVALVSGDLIEAAFPGTADATLADIAITIPGIRQ